MVSLGTIDGCYEEEDARRLFPDGTMSGIHVLTSIKFAEREEEEWKYKGRAVLLGDYIKRLRDHKQVYPSASSTGIFGPVTTLHAARAVFARALLHNYDCETIDLKNAYIQAEWPDNVAPHFLRLSPEFINHLPESYKKQMDGKAKPLWRMKRCLYGHPLSGHIWINTLVEFLRSKGWKSLPDDPALLQRGNTWLCIYVDDIAASGPTDELKALWDELGKRFEIGAHERLTDFLGMRVIFEDKSTFRKCKIDMSDYVKMVIEEYKKLWPDKTIYNRSTPIADELRHETEASVPTPRVQKLVGMLLWLSRCSRIDISMAVSRLGSRVSRWDSKCEVQLNHLIGYLQSHTNYHLTMKFNKGDSVSDLDATIFTDANLASSGKSQSGYLLAVTGKNGTFVPIGWSSKKQPITADSTPAAELIATHFGVREALTLACAVQLDVKSSDNKFEDQLMEPIKVFNDNTEVIRNSCKGISDTLGVIAKALRLRISLLKDLSNMGIIKVAHVRSVDNPSDIFTKALSKIKHGLLCNMCGMGR